MRVSNDQIKRHVLHPEEAVRCTAVEYFAECSQPDPSIMPLVIDAVERFGRDRAFRLLRRADQLPQTEASVAWLTAELTREMDLEDVSEDNYRSAVALLLQGASPSLLRAEMVELPNFPEELRTAFLERLEMANWGWHQAWTALKELGAETALAGVSQMRYVRRARRLVEVLARHRDHAEEVLALLRRRDRVKDHLLQVWLGGFLLELAGAMRLEPAVPELVERMHHDDWYLCDCAQRALQWIGGDRVVGELGRHWPDGSDDFRLGAAEVMGHIHTDLSATTCLELLGREREEDTRHFLGHALLGNFVADAIEPIRQMVPGAWGDLSLDELDLRYHLLIATTIMEADFPEYEPWCAHAADDRWGWPDYPVDPIRVNFSEDPADDKPRWEEDEAWWDEEEMEFGDDEFGDDEFGDDGFGDVPVDDLSYLDQGPAPRQPFRREQKKVGRNDPCPCGSGKKYKKCCLRKPAEPGSDLDST